jgi:hypothetical protein
MGKGRLKIKGRLNKNQRKEYEETYISFKPNSVFSVIDSSGGFSSSSAASGH